VACEKIYELNDLGIKPRVMNLSTGSRLLFSSFWSFDALGINSSRNPGVIVTPVKTGVHPHPLLTWIPFFNGMTDGVRHRGAGGIYPEAIEGSA
jgi:hypothetical protein